MVRLPRFLLVASLTAFMAWGTPAHATSIAPLTVEQMVDASDIIATGIVRSVHAELISERRIVTYAEIEVDGVSKGIAEVGDFVTVESPGGVLDDGMMSNVEAAARYSVGERVLVFLCEKRQGTSFGTVGMTKGKFTIKQDPRDGSDMLVQFTLPYTKAFDARFVPNPPAASRVGLSAMVDRVEARVEQGWDGRSIPGVSDAKLREINKLQSGVK